MTVTFAGALRRARRLMRPARMSKANRKMQVAMADLLVTSTMAPLTALTPKTAKTRKPATPKVGRALGTVLKQLRAAQSLIPAALAGAKRRDVSPRIPAGAQFLARQHRSAAGSRGYKLYLSASQPKRPKGLILMLHGCNQTPDDFAIGTHMNAMAEKHGLAIAYAAQTKANNRSSCWNWFKPGDQGRGAGEPAILASLAQKLMREFGLGRERVFVAGLSAGGSMAAILADVYPDVFSAAGVHSGLARGSASGVLSAMSAMRNGSTLADTTPATAPPSHVVRRIVFQGDRDSTIDPSNAPVIVAAAMGDTAVATRVVKRSVRGRGYARSDYSGPDGTVLVQLWMLEGAGHAWSGGRSAGSFTDRKGPDASAQMVRFFLAETG